MSNLDILCAYKQEKIDSFKLQSMDEVMKILDTSYKLFEDRSKWLQTFERIEILQKACSIIQGRAEELANTAAKEGGKPLMDSRVEIARAIDGIQVAIKELGNVKGEEIAMNLNPASVGRMAFTFREPRGVVFAISAFNHPFNLIIHQVITALAVGCPVIVKPAPTTPISCKNLVEILYEAGLKKDWCQMIMCENEVAEAVVKDTRISFLTFIGSAKVGWYLRSKLAAGAACALEHGGAAPVIFDKTADIEKAMPLLVKGGFYHAGQVCVSVQRVFVEESIAKDFANKMTEQAKKLVVGDPNNEKTEVGPLITPNEVNRVHEWVNEAKSMGGEILCGGEKVSDTCYAPTVIFNPSDDAKVSKLEIFGPVVVIYPYKSREEAIKRANQLDYCFQASVFSNDLNKTLDTVKKLNAMAVMVNDHTAFRVDWMPFGGHKSSGLGVGGIGPSMKDMTLEKLMVIKS